jgi:RNA polymerase sigma-70 factor (ECF subfamily)
MGLPAAESERTSQDTEALYREHGAAVAGLCRSLLRDRAEAEDAAQQVFLSAHRALLNGAAPREPRAWLLAVARNECYGRFQQRAVAPVPVGEAPEAAVADASVHALRAGELAGMWNEIERLPAAQREAFLLREIRGLSYTQLAAELSLSPRSVRSLLLRARTRLRHRLRGVAALGGVPWVQALLRLVGGGDGASPLPAATKAAAVGLGTLALVSGGDVPRAVRHPSAAPTPATRSHTSVAHPRRHVVVPTAVVTAPREDRREREGRGSEHEGRRDDRSGHDRSRGREGRRGRDDGSAVASPAARPTTDDHGGSGDRSSGRGGPGPSSGSDGPGGSDDGGSDGGHGGRHGG